MFLKNSLILKKKSLFARNEILFTNFLQHQQHLKTDISETFHETFNETKIQINCKITKYGMHTLLHKYVSQNILCDCNVK